MKVAIYVLKYHNNNHYLIQSFNPLLLRKAALFGSLPRKFFSRSIPSSDPRTTNKTLVLVRVNQSDISIILSTKQRSVLVCFNQSESSITSRLQDHRPVVHPSAQTQHTLLVEPGLEHVLAVDLGPEVAIVLSIVPHQVSEDGSKVGAWDGVNAHYLLVRVLDQLGSVGSSLHCVESLVKCCEEDLAKIEASSISILRSHQLVQHLLGKS